jgi:transcriptional regulator with XRE-family HTH domain
MEVRKLLRGHPLGEARQPINGKRMREARRRMGRVSLRRLEVLMAEAGLRVAAPTLFCWEAGKRNPSDEALAKLAGVLGVDPSYLRPKRMLREKWQAEVRERRRRRLRRAR